MPGLVGFVEGLELLAVEGGGEAGLLVVEAARTVAQQLVQSHDYEQRRLVVFEVQCLFLLGHELHPLQGRLAVGVAQVDVLEAQILAYFVVVRDVDANWDAAGGKGKDVQTSEIRFFEVLDLEVSSPRQILERSLGPLDQLGQQKGLFLVDHCDEAFELCSDFEGVEVALDEADVGLDDGRLVLDPVALGVEVPLHVARPEMLDILFNHLALYLVGGVFLGLSEVVVDLPQKRRKLPILHLYLDSLVLDRLLSALNRCHLYRVF